MYKLFWRTGNKRNFIDKEFENLGKAKSYGTKAIKTHYVDEITIYEVLPDGVTLDAIMYKRRTFKDDKPYYSEWIVVED